MYVIVSDHLSAIYELVAFKDYNVSMPVSETSFLMPELSEFFCLDSQKFEIMELAKIPRVTENSREKNNRKIQYFGMSFEIRQPYSSSLFVPFPYLLQSY